MYWLTRQPPLPHTCHAPQPINNPIERSLEGFSKLDLGQKSKAELTMQSIRNIPGGGL